MTDDSRDLYIAKDAANFDFQGQTVFIDRSTVARAGHPILNDHADLFMPLHVHYEVHLPEPEVAKVEAEEPEKDEDKAPASHVRADQRGARTR